MRGVRVALLATLACLALVSPAAAGKPVMEKVTLNDIGILDEFLTEECGFDIFIDGTGHIIFRTFLDDEGAPVREVNNFGIHIRIYSDWGSLRVVDVGVDLISYNEDGSITQIVIGNLQSIQLPGQGRVYSNVGRTVFLVTFPDPDGEPVVEIIKQSGQHSEVSQVDVICEALAP
jgi:hypothetical protein